MIAITGRRYGWLNLLGRRLLHLPLFRFLVHARRGRRRDVDWPPFCSQAVSMACRAGGVDPVPNLADRLTEPADLARSAFYDTSSRWFVRARAGRFKANLQPFPLTSGL